MALQDLGDKGTRRAAGSQMSFPLASMGFIYMAIKQGILTLNRSLSPAVPLSGLTSVY